ncbi:hypothetical protein M422DRAFT_95009, partial [Sphaerobolus stellatus SS14]
STVTIWQQNFNRSFIAQQDMLQTVDPSEHDIIAVQEPAIDKLGRTPANSRWRVLYPTPHLRSPAQTRALFLINKNIPTDSYAEIHTLIKTEGGFLEIFNIYLDGEHSGTLAHVEKGMRNGDREDGVAGAEEGTRGRGRGDVTTHRVCLGDFNRHHPMWDEPRNAHLFTKQNLDKAQLLLDFLAGQDLFMALPAGLPTLEASTTKNLTRPDNVFCTEELLNAMKTCEVKMEDRPAATDHFPIRSVFSTAVSQIEPKPKYNFRDVDWEEF